MAIYSSTVYLNANGWSLDSNPTTSNLLGNWSNRRDEVITNTPDSYGIWLFAGITANTLKGNDLISGTSSVIGINNDGTINTGEGNDIVFGESPVVGIANGLNSPNALINTGKGNDTILAKGIGAGLFNLDNAIIDTAEGNDTILATGGQSEYGDGIYNRNIIKTGEGNDAITANGISHGILNVGSSVVIDTGEGNDTITSTGTVGIFNAVDIVEGPPTDYPIINTGDGNDTILATGAGVGFGPGIYNQATINTGKGNDKVTANGGFIGEGSLFLGYGNDYLKGFGSGKFYGGDGKDTLTLPSDHYTVGSATIGSETFVTLSLGGTTMNTREFESLIIGSRTYNFASLTPGSVVG